MTGPVELLLESGVNPEGAPFVVIRWGRESGQLTPAEARAFAMQVMAAAEAAIHDAAFLAWLQDEPLTLDVRRAAGVLADQRQYRARLGDDGP